MMRARNMRLLSEALETAARFALNPFETIDDETRERFIEKLDNEFWIAVDERFIVDEEVESL